MISDAHLHLQDFLDASGIPPKPESGMLWCASAHEPAEFAAQEALSRAFPGQIRLSFGIHPQEPVSDHADFLASLVRDGRVDAVGECGFDLFDEGFKSTLAAQRDVWNMQLELAVSSGLPLVVHCRKALNLVFADTRRLKRVRAVVFHGWPGSVGEARSFLARGVNAYFSAGKGLLRGDRSLCETVAALCGEKGPDGRINRLLTETDSPWMTSRGERYSSPGDIRAVLRVAASLASMAESQLESAVECNFRTVFGDRPVSS
jgi:TatD DNase family protein